MGNCMNTCLPKPQSQDAENYGEEIDTKTTTYLRKQQRQQAVEEEVGNGAVSTEKKASLDGIGNDKEEQGDIEKGRDRGIVRVKVVLTKEELQWLMMQLKNDGEKKLEKMLEEIVRGRQKVVCDGRNGNGWKPSQESIMETPECLEIDYCNSLTSFLRSSSRLGFYWVHGNERSHFCSYLK